MSYIILYIFLYIKKIACACLSTSVYYYLFKGKFSVLLYSYSIKNINYEKF